MNKYHLLSFCDVIAEGKLTDGRFYLKLDKILNLEQKIELKNLYPSIVFGISRPEFAPEIKTQVLIFEGRGSHGNNQSSE